MKKKCKACGRVYDAKTWALLSVLGTMDDGVQPLELRNCTCGNTLAIEVINEN